MFRLLFVNVFFLLSLRIEASTFIGNGGRASDVELVVTREHIFESMTQFVAMKKETTESEEQAALCRCPQFLSDHPLCEFLKNLNKEQALYCGRNLLEKSDQIAKLVGDSSNVNFVWTGDQIEVLEGKERRAVDAVTDFSQNKITINWQQFEKMRRSDRILLLTHELFHLVKVDEKPLTDVEAAGPFEGTEGGRQFLNSLGAAVAVYAIREGIIERKVAALNRSRNERKSWFEFFIGSFSTPEDKATYLLKDQRSSTVNFQYRYQWSSWGAFVGGRNVFTQKSPSSALTVRENIALYGGGLSYRFKPFSDPLSWFGQSHFVSQLGGYFARFDYSIFESTYGSIDDSTQGLVLDLALTYHMPLNSGWWLTVGGEIGSHEYKYKKLDLKYKRINSSLEVGVCYGF